MSKTSLGFSLVFATLATSCGPSAEEQCTDLIETVCKRVRVCTEEATDEKLPASFESECVKEVEKSAGVCSKATDVSSSYDDCVDDLESIDCEDFLTGSGEDITIGFPSTCKGVIKVE